MDTKRAIDDYRQKLIDGARRRIDDTKGGETSAVDRQLARGDIQVLPAGVAVIGLSGRLGRLRLGGNHGKKGC